MWGDIFKEILIVIGIVIAMIVVVAIIETIIGGFFAMLTGA